MGLSIHAVSHIKYVRPITHDEWAKLDEELADQDKGVYDLYVHLHENDDFPEHLEGMKLGLYEKTDKSENFQFGVGSYSRYDWWRKRLYKFVFPDELGIDDMWADPSVYEGEPFVELINFTDCDGRIGTKVAKKLADDFATHEPKVATWVESLKPNKAKFFREKYLEFNKAFQIASQDGMLEFC